ncbi:hypothetical protein BDV29DRAFT_177558 [Aspergillus leporis]|uniref:Uncharacterized protein n=1 Tax=Aspergillus leporis TaxID=41062 RepID=A0A5N5WUZ7_9EURO|nr:hypothetical protein BDV29DRAFT_177558 [Aspergillus leporis]
MASPSDNASKTAFRNGSAPRCTLKRVVLNGTILALLTSDHVCQAAAIPNTALQERSLDTSAGTSTVLPRTDDDREELDELSNEWSTDHFPGIATDEADNDHHYVEVRSPQGVRGGRGRGGPRGGRGGRGALRGRERLVERDAGNDRRSASEERESRSPQGPCRGRGRGGGRGGRGGRGGC